MIAKLLAPDKETLDRMFEGCRHYGLKYKHNKRLDPYVHVEVNTEEDAENLFWLGANLSHPKIETGLMKSSF